MFTDRDPGDETDYVDEEATAELAESYDSEAEVLTEALA